MRFVIIAVACVLVAGHKEEEDRTYVTQAQAFEDVIGSLAHFRGAVTLDPTNSQQHENLALVLMRVGLLDEARVTLDRAKELRVGQPMETLTDTFLALESNVAYAGSFGHDTTTMYAMYGKGMGNRAQAPRGRAIPGSESDVVLDLSKPLGVSIGEDASVDSVKPGGQCEAAGVRAGDRVVAAGLSNVASLDDFKAAVSSHKKDGFSKLVLTVQHTGAGHGAQGNAATPERVESPVSVRKAEGDVGVQSNCDVPAPDHLSPNLDQPAMTRGATVAWRQGDDAAPVIPGVVIYKPDQISKVVRYTVDRRSFAEPQDCGYTEFVAAFDLRGDYIMGVIDNFFGERMVKNLVNTAVRSNAWDWAPLDPDKEDPSNRIKSNSFPGLRVNTEEGELFSKSSLVAQCLKPATAMIDPRFDFDNLKSSKTLFGLLHPRQGKFAWLGKNRIPHTDVIHAVNNYDNNLPTCYASVLSLTRDFNRTGTGVWMDRESGLSLLRNVGESNRANGNINPYSSVRRFPELDLLKEVPNPPFSHTSHVWAEAIMVAELRFNRFSFYDCRRLHQVHCSGADARRLSTDPAKGRLTMNSFFWM